MIVYIISGILVIIVLMIIGLILRKRIYDEVDRYESWKFDIMNRNVASELARIKKLNLSGETQEKFDGWKESWEHIVTKKLPEIEDYLFDAEEAADKYRFPTAKKTLEVMEQNLQTIEKDIEKILAELEDLLESEETSRKEVEEIQPELEMLRKQITQNRYQYGKAEVRFEVELDELNDRLKKYFDLTESGNYIEAKQLVDELKSDLEKLAGVISEFPEVYKQCKQELPAQLDDLYSGLKTMKEEGFHVEHLGFEKEIRNYQKRLLDYLEVLNKGEIAEAKTFMEELNERITEMYQLLEKEAVAKNYLESKIPGYDRTLTEVASSFLKTKEEVDRLKNTYYFDDRDMEKYVSLENAIAQLRKQFEEITAEMSNEMIAHSDLREQLENGFTQLEDIEQRHEALKTTIKNLRKDELEAKDQLTEMRQEIYNTNKKINKSNIPGVPGFIWNSMDEALEKTDRVLQALEKEPLDISEVQLALTEAKRSIDHLTEQTNLMLEQAHLTEQVIQYANRYRSVYPLLAAKLSESEHLFRSFEYELALEKAAEAIEEIEPGALKRIEEYQTVLS